MGKWYHTLRTVSAAQRPEYKQPVLVCLSSPLPVMPPHKVSPHSQCFADRKMLYFPHKALVPDMLPEFSGNPLLSPENPALAHQTSWFPCWGPTMASSANGAQSPEAWEESVPETRGWGHLTKSREGCQGESQQKVNIVISNIVSSFHFKLRDLEKGEQGAG